MSTQPPVLGSAPARQAAQAVGVPAHLISSMGMEFEYSLKGSGEGEGGRECAVCLGEYRETEALRQLHACGHSFHQVRPTNTATDAHTL